MFPGLTWDHDDCGRRSINTPRFILAVHPNAKTTPLDLTRVLANSGNDALVNASVWHIGIRAQILPSLQGDRDVAVFPNEIVERAEVEFVALLHPCFGQKFYNLE